MVNDNIVEKKLKLDNALSKLKLLELETDLNDNCKVFLNQMIKLGNSYNSLVRDLINLKN